MYTQKKTKRIGEKPFPATGNRKQRRGRTRNLTSQSNAFTELPTSKENKKGGGLVHIYSIIKLIVSSDNTHETKEIQKKNLGYFISSNK